MRRVKLVVVCEVRYVDSCIYSYYSITRGGSVVFSVRLSSEEEKELEEHLSHSGSTKSEVVRAALKEYFRRSKKQRSSYQLGESLFGVGDFAEPPAEPLKRKIWEKLRDKHDMG